MQRIAAASDIRNETANGFRCGRCKSPLIEGARFCSTCGREFQQVIAGDIATSGSVPEEYGPTLESRHRQAVVNTFVQTSGTIVLATAVLFVVYLCTR